MKGGSPAYALHQSEGLLSQETTVDHVKPLTVYESNTPEHYSNLYQVSGGARKRRRRSKRRSLRKKTKTKSKLVRKRTKRRSLHKK
tara:strand:- start:133 stop:390 length:258 start_codon:yes stop_codon:yes gene_type:complete